MKKYGVLLIAVILAVTFSVEAYAAADKTASVSASVTIAGSTSMSASPGSITFGTFNVDAFPTTPADKKIVITYSTNYNPWKIAIYTNNTQVKLVAAGGKYSKGGLATADGASIVPCKWVAKVGTNTVVPTVPTFTSAHNFIKDLRDEDDPSTAAYDESWADAYAAGYANIAYGSGPGSKGVCVDPTNSAVGPTQYQGDEVDGSIAVYVAGLFGTGSVGAGTYNSNILFDLYHE